MIWVLYGEDDFRRSERRKTLTAELLQELPVDFALTIWRGKGFSEETFPQLYEPPFLAPYKVVVVAEAETLTKSELRLLEKYFRNPAPTTRLILDFAQTEKPKLPEGQGITYESFTSLRPKEATDWVLSRAESLGLRLLPESAALLVELLGVELGSIHQALEALSLYRTQGRDKPLLPEEIAQALGLHPQYTPYKLIDAIAEGKVQEALQIGAAFAEDTRNYPLAQISWHLRSFYQNLARLHLSRTPANSKAIQDKLGLRFSFQSRVYERALGRFSLAHCHRALRILREAEARQKGVFPSRQTERQLLLDLIEKLTLPDPLPLR
ncbi:MAG: DNA polymerase III subunit delta [Bacteroidia bacterium]|nr:DNA polymerase III subunit delta [Bacteroidia bacterium]